MAKPTEFHRLLHLLHIGILPTVCYIFFLFLSQINADSTDQHRFSTYNTNVIKSVLHNSITLVLFNTCLAAQDLPFRNIGINEGLPSTETYSIIQDDEGYVWCSSDAGVCRFNGNSFTLFNAKNGLTDNTVFQLYKDKKGRIWMPCFNGTISYYENGKIYQINANPELSAALQGSICIIQSLAIIEGDTLLIGTTKSAFKIPPAQNYAKLIPVKKSNFVIAIEQYGESIVSYTYILKSPVNPKILERPIKFKLQNKISYEKFPLEDAFNPRFCAILDSKNNILFSQHTKLYIKTPDKINLLQTYEQYITSLYTDPKGGLWVGLSKGGIYYYPLADLSKKPYHFLDGHSVSGILVDNENGIWATTLEKGIFYVPFFNYWKYTSPGLNEKITGMYCFKNKVYIANYKNEIFILDKNGKLTEVKHEKGQSTSSLCRFYEIKGKLFFCGHNSCTIDEKGNCTYFTDSSGAIFSIVGIVETDSDNFMAASYGNYFLVNHKQVINSCLFPQPARSSGLLPKTKEQTWFGTNKGLYIFSKNTFKQDEICNELLNERITYLKKDTYDNLLVCTRTKGLFILGKKGWNHISEKDGLPSDLCNHLVIDKKNRIWLATNKGLAFFTLDKSGKKSSEIISLTLNHGLPTNEINALALRNNELYVGTRDGLCKINTNKLFFKKHANVPIIQSVYVKGKMQENIPASQLNYTQNELRFYIDCNTFKDNFSPPFFYRLVGFDTTLKLSTSSYIEFLSLAPGNYRLEAYGYENGLPTRQKSVFSFSILGPWYYSWWFFILIGLILFAIIYLFIVYRIRNIRKKEEEKTRINKLLAEYQLTALQAQMNPHFIFNAITSIQNYILKKQDAEAYDYLAKFSKLIRMVLNNSETKTVPLSEELETLKLYTELEQLRFKHTFNFNIFIDEKINPHTIMVPTMLIQPYVENAIWHGLMNMEDSTQGILSIKITEENNVLKILVEDNGIGRKKSAELKKTSLHKPMAMKLTEKRFAIINSMSDYKDANVKIRNLNEKEGTIVEINLPYT